MDYHLRDYNSWQQPLLHDLAGKNSSSVRASPNQIYLSPS